jgi:hypothetical protein
VTRVLPGAPNPALSASPTISEKQIAFVLLLFPRDVTLYLYESAMVNWTNAMQI